jgi:MFS family permease
VQSVVSCFAQLIETGGVIITDDFLNVHGLRGKTSLIGTVTAIYDVGCFFGAVSTMYIGDRLGRKKCVLLGTTIMSIGAILQIASFSTAQMIVGRIVAGMSNECRLDCPNLANPKDRNRQWHQHIYSSSMAR